MSSPRTYTIRGIADVTNTIFNCQGLLSQQPNFAEITDVPTEAKAIELLLTGTFKGMITALPPVLNDSFIDVLNVKAVIHVGTTAEAKKLRKQLAESIKTWAEKSRVRGVRGWRAHALKAPKIAKLPAGDYELDFDAILGHAVFYNNTTMSVGHCDDASFITDTIADLKKHLQRQHPGLIGDIHADHAAKSITVFA